MNTFVDATRNLELVRVLRAGIAAEEARIERAAKEIAKLKSELIELGYEVQDAPCPCCGGQSPIAN